MTVGRLSEKALRFIRSSNFQFGDTTSFRIYLDDQRRTFLPGKHDPSRYLDNLGIGAVTGKTAVVCPGNGGLVSEMILRGADEVHSYEPRKVFTRGLTGVLDLLSESNEYLVVTHDDYPPEDNKDTFDMIVWSENFDVCLNPEQVFRRVVDSLTPSGELFIEVTHGSNKNSRPGRINSWTPTREAFLEFVSAVCPEFKMTEVSEGRLTRRVVYRLTRNVSSEDSELVVILDEDGDSSLSEDEELKRKAKAFLAKIAHRKRSKDKGDGGAP